MSQMSTGHDPEPEPEIREGHHQHRAPAPHEPAPQEQPAPPQPDASRREVSADPFAPAGITFQPVSEDLIKVRLISNGVWLVPMLMAAIGLAVFLSTTGFHWTWIIPVFFAALIGWLLWLIPRQVRAMGYAETHEDLMIRRGIMFRNLVIVPYGRMQDVVVDAGPLDRAFGVAQVKLNTASAQSDAVLPGLRPREAARLRDRLAEAGEAQMAGL